MISKSDFFISKVLGSDFMESLSKSDLWKPGTQTVLDLEEIKVGLKVVPRAVLAFLKKELSQIPMHENKRIVLPFAEQTVLNVSKVERDTYIGNIEQENKIIVDFKYRSLPGLGLVIMSALELYDIENLKEEKVDSDISEKVQRMIDERLVLHDLVNKVVDNKLSERDAIQQLIMAKLGEVAEPLKVEAVKIEEPAEEEEKNLPLSDFMETVSKKRAAKAFNIKLAKGDHINCPDCGQTVLSKNLYTGCVCMGENTKSQVYIQKSDDGIKVRFGSGWSLENIEMLLEVLRGKNK